MDELDAAAGYFEDLGMDTQVELLDAAQEKAEDVKELLECLLGRVYLTGGPEAKKQPKPKPKAKKPLGKAHLVKRVA